MRPETAIANLIATYAERIDLGDFEGLAALFEHAVVTSEGTDIESRGPDQVRAMYDGWTRVFGDGTPRTKHVTTNHIIEVDDDESQATCRSYFTVFQQTDALALQPIIAGRYHDEFAVIDGRWHFTRRHMISELFGDLSQHLLQEL